MIERFFRSLKEKCVWQHVFSHLRPGAAGGTGVVRWYNDERPRQALGYRSPREFRAGEAAAA